MQITEAYLDSILEQRIEMGLKGRESSTSHLKAALYDWRVERHWDNKDAAVLTVDAKSFAFVTFTKRTPKYCVLRHITTLEEHRGTGIATNLMNKIYNEMTERGYTTIRFFADKPSIGFYEKLGYKWHGHSKTGLPFTYTDIDTMELVPVIKRDQKRLF
jgi:GNAT superfamily N-acetyltransferase